MKSVIISARVDKSHRDLARAAARAEGVSVSQYIAAATTRAARRTLSGMLDSFGDDTPLGSTPANLAELFEGFTAPEVGS